MKLPVSNEWLLHCATTLAQLDPSSSASAAQLAEHYGLPPASLAKQLQLLVKAGILSATSGSRGGFRLSRPFETVSLLHIVEAIDGASTPYTCRTSAGVRGGDRLHQQRSDPGNALVLAPPRHHGGEAVELRERNDGPGHWPLGHQSSLFPIARVVERSRHAVHSRDREQPMVAHARAYFGGKKVLGDAAEAGHDLRGFRRDAVRDIHDGVHLDEGFVQPFSGLRIYAERAAIRTTSCPCSWSTATRRPPM